MKKYRVWQTKHIDYYADVEAESPEEAYKIVEGMNEDELTEYIDDWTSDEKCIEELGTEGFVINRYNTKGEKQNGI